MRHGICRSFTRSWRPRTKRWRGWLRQRADSRPVMRLTRWDQLDQRCYTTNGARSGDFHLTARNCYRTRSTISSRYVMRGYQYDSTKGVSRIFHWRGGGAKPEGRRPTAGVLLWGGAATRSPPARGLEERCELPQPGSGRALTAQRFSTIFVSQDGLS